MRILVVEDDLPLREAVGAGLRASGLAVDAAADIRSARRQLAEHSYDCLVLDRMLPDGDGLALLDELSGGDHPPSLVLTARDAIRDRVRGFERGADDYLVKPFAMAELVARVRTLCRRRRLPVTPPSVSAGSIEIDLARREVRRFGVQLALTPKEFAVLELLATRAGHVVGRSELVEHCWDELTAPMSNAVDVVIGQLRRKLGNPDPIRTVRGAGYLLEL
jgi:two-component system copper resistance phosphate regulon response regulator CusR